jgi:thiol:disulfide interchange protein DsbG
MKKSFPLLCLAGAALLALASFDAPAATEWTAAMERRDTPPVTWEQLEHTRWIADGRADAPRKVYVFLDANCKYCTKFWSDARPWVNAGKVQLRHIMVGVIAPSSTGKAATLLADPDPAGRLAAFEQAHAFGVVRMMAGGPHQSLEDPNLVPLEPVPAALAGTLAANEDLMHSLHLQGTPGIVFRSQDGRHVVAKPGLTPEELPQVLGPL